MCEWFRLCEVLASMAPEWHVEEYDDAGEFDIVCYTYHRPYSVEVQRYNVAVGFNPRGPVYQIHISYQWPSLATSGISWEVYDLGELQVALFTLWERMDIHYPHMLGRSDTETAFDECLWNPLV